ncbi:MAG: ABC transporter substrate-binding protein [Candidatus Micrarchaeaceae archaeon]
MKSAVLAVVLVVVILASAAGGVFAGSSLNSSSKSASTVTQTQSVTQTVQISGSLTLAPQTVTTTAPATTVTSTVSATANNACTTPSTVTQITVGGSGAANGVAAAEYVAIELGFFRQQGLNVTEEYTAANVMFDNLVSNNLDFAQGSGILTPYLAGATNLVALMSEKYAGSSGGGIAVNVALYKSGTVTKVSELNGMRVGTQSAPSNPYTIAQLYEKYYKVNYTVIQYATNALAIAALETGQIAAFVGISGQSLQPIVAAGEAVTLVDPNSITPQAWNNILAANGYTVPAGGYFVTPWVTNTQMVQQHPAVVQEFVNAITEGEEWVASHNATQILNVIYKDPTIAASTQASGTANRVSIVMPVLSAVMR